MASTRGVQPGVPLVFFPIAGNVMKHTETGPPGTFFVALRALIGTVQGPRSAELPLTLPGGGCTTAPNAPTVLSFTIAGTAVKLNWIASTGCPATSYIVEAGSATGLSDRGRFDTGSALPTITATGPSNTYFVRVLATNPFGTSGPSNEVIVPIP